MTSCAKCSDFADQRVVAAVWMKALRALEGAGEIQLPAGCAARPRHRGVLREHPAPVAVPATVSAVATSPLCWSRPMSAACMEYPDRGGASAGDDDLRRVSVALSRHLGTRLAAAPGRPRRFALRRASAGWRGATNSARAILCCASRFLIRPRFRARIWRAMFWGGCCGAWRGILKLATATVRGLWAL